MQNRTRRSLGSGMAATLAAGSSEAQPSASAQPVPASDSFLLPVFLRHDETKTMNEINAHLRHTGYYKRFPPERVEVVTWYVMMGVGQVVTLRVPQAKLRELNRVPQETAWGGYRTEFYPV